MSKIIDLIKKLKFKPFTGKTGKADAKKGEPIPAPKPVKPREYDK